MLQSLTPTSRNVCKVTVDSLATLITMVEGGEVNRSSAREIVLPAMAETGADPREVVETQGLGAIGAGDELAGIVAKIIEDNPKQAQQLRNGQDKLIGFFVGQVMKATQGRADAKTVGDLVREIAGE